MTMKQEIHQTGLKPSGLKATVILMRLDSNRRADLSFLFLKYSDVPPMLQHLLKP